MVVHAQKNVATIVVYFEKAAETPSQTELKKLESITSLIQQQKTDITIESHTDSLGSVHLNEKLALGRGEKIRSFIKSAIADSLYRNVTFQVIAKGASSPVTNNTTAYNRSLNRRVE